MSNLVPRLFKGPNGFELSGLGTSDVRSTLFDATQVARTLGWSNPSKAVTDLVWPEYKKYIKGENSTNGRPKPFLTIAGVSQLILKSKLPGAIAIQKWIYEEIMPMILFGDYSRMNDTLKIQELQRKYNYIVDQVGKFGEALCELGSSNQDVKSFVFEAI